MSQHKEFVCIEQDDLKHLTKGEKYLITGYNLHGDTGIPFLYVQSEFPVTGYYNYALFFPAGTEASDSVLVRYLGEFCDECGMPVKHKLTEEV